MELNEVMTWVISIITIVVVWGIKWYQARSGKEISTKVLQWLCYGIALVLALVFQAPGIPMISLAGLDPAQIVSVIFAWVADLLVAVSPMFALATLIYTTMLKGWLDGLGRKFFSRG